MKKAKIHFPSSKGSDAVNRVRVRYISPAHILSHGTDVNIIVKGEKYLPDGASAESYISNMYESVEDTEVLIEYDGEYFAINARDVK